MKSKTGSDQVMLNVRVPRALKQQGDEVLARNGVSASEAIRGMYSEMVESQKLPPFLKADVDRYEKRRAKLRSVAGLTDVPEDYCIEDLRRDRRSRYDG